MKHSSPSHITTSPSQGSAEKWYAIYTKFKTEKYVADHLAKKGIEVYLPLLTTTKRYVRKVRVTKVPLINCYLFVKINEQEKARVLQTEYVYKFISQGKTLQSIPQAEIDLLKRVVGEFEGQVETGPITWEPGEAVEVIAGSLTGLKGKLIERKSKNHFVVELEAIGYELQLEVNKSQLRLLNKVA